MAPARTEARFDTHDWYPLNLHTLAVEGNNVCSIEGQFFA